MRFKLILSLLISFSFQAQSQTCPAYAKYLADPKIRDNAHFWIEYAEVSAKGSDQDIVNLLKRFKVDVDGASASATSATAAVQAQAAQQTAVSSGVRFTNAYSLSHEAEKDLRNLQPGLRAKLDDFLQIAKKGSSKLLFEIRAHQGRWQLEKLGGSQGMSVRLNQGYRVVFREGDDNSIMITNISKTATHGGH